MSLSFIHPKAKLINTNDSKTYICSKVGSNYIWNNASFSIHKFYNYQLNDVADAPIPSFELNHLYYKNDCIIYNSKYYMCKSEHYSTDTDFDTNKYWENYTEKLSSINVGDYTIACQKNTNEIKYSENFSSSYWIKHNVFSDLEYSTLGNIISPKLNDTSAYSMILLNDSTTKTFKASQLFNAQANKKYKFSIYIKNIKTKLEYVALTLFHENASLGYSVIFDLLSGSFVKKCFVDSDYTMYDETYVQYAFNNMNYLIEYLNDSHTDMRLTIMSDILIQGFMEAQINFIGKESDELSYNWTPTSGVYKTYVACAQVASYKMTATAVAPKYISTTNTSRTLYTADDIYLKTNDGNIKQDISLHFYNDNPYISDDVEENDIGVCNGLITLDNLTILGNKDPFKTQIIHYAYGVQPTDENLAYALIDSSYPTDENKKKLYIHPNISRKVDRENVEYLFYDKNEKVYYFKNKKANYKVLASKKHYENKNRKYILNALTFTDSLYNSSGKVITSDSFYSH